jgi:hypothetical protein
LLAPPQAVVIVANTTTRTTAARTGLLMVVGRSLLPRWHGAPAAVLKPSHTSGDRRAAQIKL